VTKGNDDAPAFDSDLLAAGRLAVGYADRLLTVTLDAPDVRNAQLPATWIALAHIGSRITDAVRVVVLTGKGPSFSAGLDRSAFTGGPDSPLTFLARAPDSVADERIAVFQSGFTWLADPSFVSIAAVRGHAVGAGFQLALACDLIVAAQDAQFTMAEVGLGLVPDLGGTGPLIRAVGPARALEICATGRRVPAAEALRLGIAVDVVSGDELDHTVADLAARLMANDAETVRAVTRLIVGAVDRSSAEQLAAERQEQIGRVRALLALSTG
jgi:enoyl-CoA hydratase/carnithine racemase